MDIPDIDLLDEILADMAKQSVGKGGSSSSMGPSKQSINISNGPSNPDNSANSNGKSVRFTQPKPVSPPKDQMPPIPPPPPTIRTPTPPNINGHGMGLPNGKNPHGNHNTPLQIQVDTLHVPGDRSFLHSPSGDILAGNSDGPVTPIMRTPSPRADYGLKSPTVLQKVITGGWVPTEKHADASEACPVFSANDNSDDARFQSYHLDYKYTPPPIKGPCCVCGDGIMGSMVTALDKMWHPEHFCCVHCHKELRPPHFTEHTGQPYCKACHNMLFLPPCAGCNREIQGNYIQPMGKVWHPECFQCTQCTKVLNPNDFFERNGKPYCDDCRHDLFSPKCHGCKKPIKDDRKVTALGGLTWHPTCFKCCKCSGVMSPSNYKEKDNRLFCENCFNDLFMPKCGGCNTPVVQKPLQALGKQWHPACFKCVDCKKTLSPDKFKDNTGKPYCDDCYHNRFSEKCAGCRQPIKDPKRMVKAQGKPWHPEHFCCTECNKQLDPNKFWEKDGKPYCEDDYHRLFSPKCAGCHQPIKNQNKMIVAQGKKWHPEHFCCVECNRQLDPNKFWEKDGKAYCEDDFHRLFSPKCAGCLQPIKTKALVALGQHWHPEHFCCTICNKQLDEYQFYERDGKPYCVDDYLRLFAPHCKQCKKPITEAYCLSALGGDWHADCFRCRDCNCLLEDANFFEINGEPYCEQHFHARQCPDCIRIRRAQNTYFGLSADTPMQVRKYASMVSLKSLEINNGTGTRPTSQMSQYSQYSTSSMELGRCGTPNGQITNGNGGNGNSNLQILQRQVSSPPGSSTYVIPIEREGASSSSALSNYQTSRSTSRNDNMYHIHDHNGQMCLSDHHVDNLLQRSSSQQSTLTNGSSSSQMIQKERANALGGKQVGWKKSQDNLQFIAKNQSPYLYNEPGKFPLLDGEGNSNKQIRFEEVMTKREYEAVQKRNY